MIRDWVNWQWLSGDIIVEQHIHHLDAVLWVLGKTPISAVGMGAHVRRNTGDQDRFLQHRLRIRRRRAHAHYDSPAQWLRQRAG